MDTLTEIMNFAQKQKSYPVIAVSYGYIASLKSMKVRDSAFREVP